MRQPLPLELLEKKLEEYKHDLDKSIHLFNTHQIDVELHLVHRRNLRKLINEYSQAIQKLKS